MKRLDLNQARVLLALEAATAPLSFLQLRTLVPSIAGDTLESLTLRGLVSEVKPPSWAQGRNAPGHLVRQSIGNLVARGLVEEISLKSWELQRDAPDRFKMLELAREIVAQADVGVPPADVQATARLLLAQVQAALLTHTRTRHANIRYGGEWEVWADRQSYGLVSRHEHLREAVGLLASTGWIVTELRPTWLERACGIGQGWRVELGA